MFHYEVRLSRARPPRRLAFEEELAPGDVVFVGDRYWIVDGEEGPTPDGAVRLSVSPARFRLVLRYPDGHEETGAVRRYGRDAPEEGHTLTTRGLGAVVSWQVRERRVVRTESGVPLLEFVAERDYGEVELEGDDHEIEHRLARVPEPPDVASALFGRVEREGLMLEMVGLDEGTEPDWQAAEEYVDSLVLEEIEDDLLELCGVDPDHDPRERWLELVKDRLLSDLRQFRDDVEGDRDEIEVWEEDERLVLASAGSWDDESAPDKGHGWMVRLVDSGALAAAGYERIHKTAL